MNVDRASTFQEARADMLHRRTALAQATESLGLKLCFTRVHPFTPWEEREFVDRSHYRKVVNSLQYVAWTNNTFGPHVHVGIGGADRAVAMQYVIPFPRCCHLFFLCQPAVRS